MEFEILTGLIQELQIRLRKEAGLASYNPNDPSLPTLPSLPESIAKFDPSPPNLRCSKCSGRLLRGLQSLICVYCGKEQKSEVPPVPIRFKSSFGYRWLLDYLELDGSEIVGPLVVESKLNRGQSTSKDETSVSDLVDFEIKWSTLEDKNVNFVSNQSPLECKSPVNMTRVDLDNFFSKPKRDTAFNASEQQLEPETQIKSKEINVFEIQEKPGLLEEAQTGITAEHPIKAAKGDNGSGWDADFQCSSSGSIHENSKSFDPFVGSNSYISAHMDTVFGLGSNKKGGNSNDDLIAPDSVTEDLNQDDPWNNFNSSLSNLPEKSKEAMEFNDAGLMGDLNNPPSSADWAAENSKASIGDFKSLDASDDFTSSSAQHPSNNSTKQSTEDRIQSDEQIANVNSFNSNNLGEMDLGIFSQPDLSSGASSSQNSSKEVTDTQLEFSALASKTDTKVEPQGRAEHAGTGLDICYATSDTKSADVETSQMHDLSFMLQNSLSIPEKRDEFGLNSQD